MDNARSSTDKNTTEFPMKMASHFNPHSCHEDDLRSKNAFNKMKAKEKYFKSQIPRKSPDRRSRFVSNYDEHEHPNVPYQY